MCIQRRGAPQLRGLYAADASRVGWWSRDSDRAIWIDPGDRRARYVSRDCAGHLEVVGSSPKVDLDRVSDVLTCDIVLRLVTDRPVLGIRILAPRLHDHLRHQLGRLVFAAEGRDEPLSFVVVAFG